MKKLLALALTVAAMSILGCASSQKRPVVNKRVATVAVYYKGSATVFDFLAKGRGKELKVINNITADQPAKIWADVAENKEEYVVFKNYRWDSDSKRHDCDRLEIHLRSTSKIGGGVIDRGKFGVQRISVIQ